MRIIFFLSFLNLGLLTSLKKSESCFGTGEDVSMFWLNLTCSSSEMISVTEMYYGVKEQNTSCEPPINNSSFTECCQYDESNDCLVDVFLTKHSEVWSKILQIFANCTGYESCYEQATWNRATGCDSETHFSFSSFMLLQYQCISGRLTSPNHVIEDLLVMPIEKVPIPSITKPKTKLLQRESFWIDQLHNDTQILQADSDIEISREEIHLQNAGYPSGTSNNSQMSCSIEAPCNSSIELTSLDIQLGSSTGTLDSSYNNMYEQRQINLSASLRFLVIDIDFADNSKLWIHLKANDTSNLDVACGNMKRRVPLDDCLPPTTEYSTTTEQITTENILTSEHETSEQPSTTEQTTEQPSTTEQVSITESSPTEQVSITEQSTTDRITEQSSTFSQTETTATTEVSTANDSITQTVRSSNNVGLIAGIVCGVFGLVVICIICKVCYNKNKKNKIFPDMDAKGSSTPPSATNETRSHKKLRPLPPPLLQPMKQQPNRMNGKLAPLKTRQFDRKLIGIESPNTDNVNKLAD